MKNSQIPFFDLLIIGGGINGVGIANDAAGRGLKVALCEQNDLGSGTSWKSSKLIHGGLRYLQYYDFNLVHKALREREILLKKAPHIIQPLEFVLPHDRTMYPTWMMRIGLFLYDHLAKRRILPASHFVNLKSNELGRPLKSSFTHGFTYYDCYVDDARLVILNAVQAKESDATIYPRTKFITAQRYPTFWQITLQDTLSGKVFSVKSKVIVNATGPWIEQILKILNVQSLHRVTLVKGSHIVVPKFYEGNHAYVLQNTDKRVIFTIPFANDFSMIGTTDVAFNNDPGTVTITADETNYLTAVMQHFFNYSLEPKNIVWSFSGVRALHQESAAKNLSAISRDYLLELNTDTAQAPLLNIFGGKITTYRELSEHALKILQPYFPKMGKAWTKTTPLPGGDMPNFSQFLKNFSEKYYWLPAKLAQRYAKNYGTRAEIFLNKANSLKDLGDLYGTDLYQREVEYLCEYEWAMTPEDILWRRTKLGLTFSSAAEKELEMICKLSFK